LEIYKLNFEGIGERELFFLRRGQSRIKRKETYGTKHAAQNDVSAANEIGARDRCRTAEKQDAESQE